MIRSSAFAVTLVALACATESVSVIPAPPELENARLRYQRAMDTSAVSERAAPELGDAARALEEAELELRSGASAEEIELLAYRVQRRLDLARWAAVRQEGEVDALATQDVADGVLGRIQAELGARHVDAEPADGRLVVTLGRQLFEGSALRTPGKTLLDRAAEVMRGHSGLRASVMGYTDDMGSAEYNQRIAQERAEAVASQLSGSGLRDGALSVKGVGEAEPRFPNTSRAGRRLNRRVELQIEAPAS